MYVIPVYGRYHTWKCYTKIHRSRFIIWDHNWTTWTTLIIFWASDKKFTVALYCVSLNFGGAAVDITILNTTVEPTTLNSRHPWYKTDNSESPSGFSIYFRNPAALYTLWFNNLIMQYLTYWKCTGSPWVWNALIAIRDKILTPSGVCYRGVPL